MELVVFGGFQPELSIHDSLWVASLS